jgi:hypothetical protein
MNAQGYSRKSICEVIGKHRLFSQMHHQAKGCIFTSYPQVKNIYERTSTKTGLSVVVRISYQKHEIGLGIKAKHIDYKRILTHPELPTV